MSQAPSVALAGTTEDHHGEGAANVSLRGTARGLEILITGTPTAVALGAQLTELLAEAPGFFAGSNARVAIDGMLPVGALACLEEIAARFELRLIEIGPAAARRLRGEIAAMPPIPPVPAGWVDPPQRSRFGDSAESCGGDPWDAAPALASDAAAKAASAASASGDAAAPTASASPGTGEPAAKAGSVPHGTGDAVAKAGSIPHGTGDAAANLAWVPHGTGDAATKAAFGASASGAATTKAGSVPGGTGEPAAKAGSVPHGTGDAASKAASASGAPGDAIADAVAKAATGSDPALVAALAAVLASVGARDAAAASADEEPADDAPIGPRLVVGPVRSGRIVDHVGHLIVVGDVNPGAEVRAEGSIIVLGRLRGVAHAAIGRDAGCIIALSLQPQQLRIGRMVARAGDADRPSGGAEIAYVTGETIVVERFSGRLPSGLAACM
jgi:septum formation inhibitor MinC